MKHFDSLHPRFATIKLSTSQQVIPCLYEELDGKRLTIRSERAISASTTVTVEYHDSLFLGEVIVCQQQDEAFKLQLKVEQVLSGLESLMALRTALLSDAPAYAPRTTPQSPAVAA